MNQVMRGASWHSLKREKSFRPAPRTVAFPSARTDILGFRIAKRTEQRLQALRGGSWDFDAHSCQSAYRNTEELGFCSGYLGFRIARRKR